MLLLESTIEMMQSASTVDGAFDLFKEFVNEHGYDNACYTLVTDHPSIGKMAYHGVTSDYPEPWMKHYRDHDYQHFDPVWLRSFEHPVPFFWNDLVDQKKRDPSLDGEILRKSLQVMNEAAEEGVADGIGLSFTNRMGEISGFGISRQQQQKCHDYRELGTIYLVATVFHDKFMSLHQEAVRPKLSQREKDILSWAAEGKSDWEIATILGIKHSTVRYHWKNIFQKLDVSSRLLATSKAIRQKLITPQTIRA
nr:LuxR family transcriptional regulator [uncultured Cohaesibacter sp.]